MYIYTYILFKLSIYFPIQNLNDFKILLGSDKALFQWKSENIMKSWYFPLYICNDRCELPCFYFCKFRYQVLIVEFINICITEIEITSSND